MDLDLPPEADTARERARAFLAEALDSDGRPRPGWFRHLADAA